jgi:hypothetical protein
MAMHSFSLYTLRIVPDGTSRWLYGAKLSRTRRLSPEEMHEIGRRLTKSHVRAAGVMLGGPSIGAIIAALAIGAGEGWLPEPVIVAIALTAAILGSAIGGPVGLLCVRDSWRLSRAVRRDLTAGEVEVYEFLPPEDACEAGAEAPEPVVAEIFPLADIVYRLDGKVQEHWPRAFAGAATSAPATRSESPVNPEFLRELPPEARYRRRPLTADEVVELSGFRSKFFLPSRTGRALFLFALLQFGFFIAALAREGSAVFSKFTLQSVMMISLLIAGLIGLIRVLRLRKLIASDLEAGEVVVARLSAYDGPAEDKKDRGLEFLPHSRMIWSVEDQPAPWRVFPKDVEDVAASDE